RYPLLPKTFPTDFLLQLRHRQFLCATKYFAAGNAQRKRALTLKARKLFTKAVYNQVRIVCNRRQRYLFHPIEPGKFAVINKTDIFWCGKLKAGEELSEYKLVA